MHSGRRTKAELKRAFVILGILVAAAALPVGWYLWTLYSTGPEGSRLILVDQIASTLVDPQRDLPRVVVDKAPDTSWVGFRDRASLENLPPLQRVDCEDGYQEAAPHRAEYLSLLSLLAFERVRQTGNR